MKLTVIGCWGGYPKANEASSGYLLEHNEFRLLIDCGSGVLSQLQNYLNPTDLDAVILTHYHADHIADIGVLHHALLIQSYLTNVKKTIPIYGHEFDQDGFNSLTYKDITVGMAYDPNGKLDVGPFSITFLQTKHPVPCYAFRIEADDKVLVFTGDSAYREEFPDFAKDADLLLCECNFYEDMDGSNAGHMNSKEAGTFAEKANVKQLILTHLPHYGNIDELKNQASKYYQGPISLAKLGQVWEI